MKDVAKQTPQLVKAERLNEMPQMKFKGDDGGDVVMTPDKAA